MDTQLDKVADAHGADGATKVPQRTVRQRLRLPLMVGLPLLLAVAGAVFYLAEEGHVSTNDAFVYAAKESVNARVSGQVVEITVKDNQRVKKGQLLFRI